MAVFFQKKDPGNRLRFRRVYKRFELLRIFVLDRSLALRFKSRRGLPRVRIARIHSSTFGARARSSARALFFLASAASIVKSKLTLWLAFGLSVVLGALIWICSQRFTGTAEPWDAPGYYWHISLLLAGFLPAVFSPQRFWLWPVGVLLGQLIIFAARVIQSPSALWPVGVMYLVLFSILTFAGAFIGWAGRRVFGRMFSAI
jgi:hypothetical protein